MDASEKKRWVRQLFVQYEGRLLRYLMKFTNSEMASEIVQETFVKLLKIENPQELQSRELPWLFRVSRNRALDRLKKEKPMSHMKPGQEFLFDSDNPEEQMNRDQQKSNAIKLLAKLNSTQKEVVRLKFQENLTYKQISEVTGHSVGHVGVILHESIKKLRQLSKNSDQKGGVQ